MRRSNFQSRELDELSREIGSFAQRLDRQQPARRVPPRPRASESAPSPGDHSDAVSDLLGRINALSSTISGIKSRTPERDRTDTGSRRTAARQPAVMRPAASQPPQTRAMPSARRSHAHDAGESQAVNAYDSAPDFTAAISRLESAIAQQAERLSSDLATSRELSDVAYAIDTLNERLTVAQSEFGPGDVARLETAIADLAGEFRAGNARAVTVDETNALSFAIERLTERFDDFASAVPGTPGIDELADSIRTLVGVVEGRLTDALDNGVSAAGEFSGLKSAIDSLSDQLDQARAGSVRPEQFAELSGRLSGLEEAVSRQTDELNGFGMMADQFDELNRAVRSLPESVSGGAIKPLLPAIEELAAQVADLIANTPSADRFDGLQNAVAEISGKIGHIPHGGELGERFESLRAHVDSAFETSNRRFAEEAHSTTEKIESLLQRNDPDTAIERIAGLVEALQENFDRLPRSDSVEKLGAEIGQVKARLEAADTSVKVDALSKDVETLIRKFDELQSGPLLDILDARFKKLEDVVSLEKLDEKYAAIASRLESLEKNVKSTQPRTMSATLKKAIKDLETAAEVFDGANLKSAIGDLDGKIDALGSRIGAPGPDGIAALAGSALPVDEIISGIVERTETVLANAPDKADLEVLSKTLDSISKELAALAPQSGDTGTPAVLDAISGLSAQLSDLMDVAEDTAQNIAREAVGLIRSQGPVEFADTPEPEYGGDYHAPPEPEIPPSAAAADDQPDDLEAPLILLEPDADEYAPESDTSHAPDPESESEDAPESKEEKTGNGLDPDRILAKDGKPRRHDPNHDRKHAALMARLREVSRKHKKDNRVQEPLENFAKPLGPDDNYVSSIDVQDPRYDAPKVSESPRFAFSGEDMSGDMSSTSRADFIAAARRAAQTAARDAQRAAEAQDGQQKARSPFSLFRKLGSAPRQEPVLPVTGTLVTPDPDPEPVENAAPPTGEEANPDADTTPRLLRSSILNGRSGKPASKSNGTETAADAPANHDAGTEDAPAPETETKMGPRGDRPFSARDRSSDEDIGEPVGADLLDQLGGEGSAFEASMDRPVKSGHAEADAPKEKRARRFPFGFRSFVAVAAAGMTGLAGWQISTTLLSGPDTGPRQIAALTLQDERAGQSSRTPDRIIEPEVAFEPAPAIPAAPALPQSNVTPGYSTEPAAEVVDRIGPQDIAAVIADTQNGAGSGLPNAASAEAAADPIVTGSLGSGTGMLAEAEYAVPARVTSSKLKAAIRRNDPYAFFELGTRYLEGRSLERDLNEAALWYQRAAEKGLAPAQYRIGNFYERGNGVARDLEKARDWYEKAANAGNVKAMHNLAVLHLNGKLGAPDYPSALRWFNAAADHGVRDSQYNLGVLYFEGLGIDQNHGQSYRWFAIAARLGDAEAGRQRDVVAGLLDQSALEAAQREVDLWVRKPAIDIANRITSPPGGWDDQPAKDANVTLTGQSTIAQTQALLAALGFDVGPADGVLGPRTRDAIRTFERNNGLPETGEISAALISRLTASVI